MQEYIEIAEMENAHDLIPKINQDIQNLEKTYQKRDRENLLNQKDDERNAFLHIHPGAGGTESQEFGRKCFIELIRVGPNAKVLK